MTDKHAIIGPLADIGNLGIPSGVGYLVAHGTDQTPETAAREVHRYYNPGPALLIPGYTGYHFGRKARAREVLEHTKTSSFDALVSPTLRTALATHGWWKLAAEVKRAHGLVAPEHVTLPAAVEALAYKWAADRVNQAKIRDGLAALARLREVP